MEQTNKIFSTLPLRLNLTRGQNCSYLPEQIEQRIATDITNHSQVHDRLAETGFRRIENWVYQPACPNCSACKPIRVVTDQFIPSKTQKRIQKKNVDIICQDVGITTTLEQYALFQRYLGMRHIDGQMASMSYDEYFSMITNSPIDTRLLEFRHRDSNDLVGCMLIDRQRDGLSAVYSFFDPEEEKRSFGSFMILYLIELTKMQRMSYLYLGYYINFSQKMSYKINFKPYEIFEKGTWQ